MFSCEICSKPFNRKDNMQRHINNIHNETQRLVKGVMPTSSYIANQQMDEFENNQLGSGYIVDNMHGVFDIRLKENFKLFVSGPSRCGKNSLCC